MMVVQRLLNTLVIMVLVNSAVPRVLAQAPPTFFQTLSRPTNQITCETMDCWLEATRSCTPSKFLTDLSIGIAETNSVYELWGQTGAGGCIYYQFVKSLEAFGQNVPDSTGMEILCIYPQAHDLTHEWEVFLGKRDGSFGGTGGLVDAKTRISISSKTLNDRQVAQCAIKSP